MNIPELSTALSSANIANKVSIAVLDSSMELSVNPAVGSNFDLYV